MLSLEKCRELLEDEGGDKYSDERIAEIRASLYGLIEMVLDDYIEKKVSK